MVGESAVVTAAHCVFDMERKDDLDVWLGAHSTNGGVKHKIKEVSSTLGDNSLPPSMVIPSQ